MKMTVLSVSVCWIGMTFSVMADYLQAGKQVFVSNACIGCHGEAGNSKSSRYPVLAGKSFEYIAVELTKFRSRERVNATMNSMASNLSDSEIFDVATYLSSQVKPKKPKPVNKESKER